MIQENPPAFPCKIKVLSPPGINTGSMGCIQEIDFPGITMRDYFAGQVIDGLLNYYSLHNNIPEKEWMAKEAYKYADVMLKERVKE